MERALKIRRQNSCERFADCALYAWSPALSRDAKFKRDLENAAVLYRRSREYSESGSITRATMGCKCALALLLLDRRREADVLLRAVEKETEDVDTTIDGYARFANLREAAEAMNRPTFAERQEALREFLKKMKADRTKQANDTDTSDQKLVESVQVDASGVLNVFSQNVPAARLKTKVRQDDQLTAQQMLSTIHYRERRYGQVQEAPVREISPAFRSLCWQPSGEVDINSSSRGEIAVGDNLVGGYFTSSLCGYLYDHSQQTVTWQDLLARVSRDVAQKFRQKHPTGVSRAEGGQTIRQSTQTVSAELDLQVDDAAALRITRIYDGSSAADLRTASGQRIRLEPGDHLAAINGERLRSIAHFREVVRAMPQGARFTLTIINKRDGTSLDVHGNLDRGGGYRLGLYVETE